MTQMNNDPLVNELRQELHAARHDLICLATKSLPADTSRLLIYGYHECKTISDCNQWEFDVIQKIIAAATPDDQRRAFCPLCRDGKSRWWGEDEDCGFALPEGLERHLTGKGRARECHIFAIANKLAHEHFIPIFHQEHRQNEEAIKTRRKTERLYRINASAPLLIDEHIYASDSRNKKQFEWAEERLRGLHFEFILDANVISYQLQRGEFIVLADPRTVNRIRFEAYRRSPTGKLQYLTGTGKHFDLPDAWTNDIPFKFRKWLDEVCIPRKTPARPSTRKLWIGKKRVLTPRVQVRD